MIRCYLCGSKATRFYSHARPTSTTPIHAPAQEQVSASCEFCKIIFHAAPFKTEISETEFVTLMLENMLLSRSKEQL